MKIFYGYRTKKMWWKIFFMAPNNLPIIIVITLTFGFYIYEYSSLPMATMVIPIIVSLVLLTLIIDTFKRWKTLPKKP